MYLKNLFDTFRIFIMFGLAVTFLASCFTPSNHGYDFSQDFKTESEINTNMYKFDVVNKLGEPSFTMGNKDYYTSIKTIKRPFLKDKILSTKYLLLEYDDSQKVTAVKLKK